MFGIFFGTISCGLRGGCKKENGEENRQKKVPTLLKIPPPKIGRGEVELNSLH